MPDAMCRSTSVAPKRSGKLTPTSKTVNIAFFLFAMRAFRRHVGGVIWRSGGGGVGLKRHWEEPRAVLGPVASNQAAINIAALSRIALRLSVVSAAPASVWVRCSSEAAGPDGAAGSAVSFAGASKGARTGPAQPVSTVSAQINS